MKKAHIIIIDDQIDVLSALLQDLKPFRERFILDDCESADEAFELMEELDVSGEKIALILSDHIMTNKNGIELFSDLSTDNRFDGVRKILITGQASHDDTIDAINNASIDYYISKPWEVEELHDIVKKMITHWI
ncbi:MAG: response regulator, partial [Candidatus Omnitrophica bacterium]|nr:response regulator [Candidatus Omnitrophota bacterium]